MNIFSVKAHCFIAVFSLVFSVRGIQGQVAPNEPGAKSETEKAVALTIKAGNELQQFRASSRTEADKYHLKRAVAYSDSAILLNTSSNGFIFLEKAEALIDMKDYDSAIQCMEQSRSRTVNEAEVVAREGFLYEKTGKSQLAQSKFKEALRLYDVQIKDKGETKYIIVNRAILFMFISQPAYAKKEYSRATRRYPHDAYVNAYSKIITDNFNKEAFLKSIFFEK
ncbi:MAG: hypothetical protein Q8928_10215 [Bacteroidota bacterium]|nr:hypothetical protein [Bacteroidota bacterium]